jgi:2-amino-4-hydroxy-6-hydroxymethyldihydropteridine diphosphokinase
MTPTTYAIAIGSNRRGRHGSPRCQVAAAIESITAADGGTAVIAVAPTFVTAPLGPSLRQFANSAVLVRSTLDPAAMLGALKRIERQLGRRGGQRWGARVIDLDIVLWSGGRWRSKGLTVPHVRYSERGFVLVPLRRIAPNWRDPFTGRSIRQMVHLVDRPRARP